MSIEICCSRATTEPPTILSTAHACKHCGRRFSLASNLRRHTSTKACKVLKFEAAKENVSSVTSSSVLSITAVVVPAQTQEDTDLDPDMDSAPTVAASPTVKKKKSVIITETADTVTSDGAGASPKKDKKRKAGTDSKPAPRRKRHAHQEPRWIPRTLALFKNAHLLTSTPPFQFCIYRAKRNNNNGSSPHQHESDEADEDDEEDVPFTTPTLPLHPVRPTMASRRSVRSVATTDSGSSSDESSPARSIRSAFTLDDDYEERNSYEAAPEYPYHPMNWPGKLPGPGLLAGDELVKNPSVARRWMSFKR